MCPGFEARLCAGASGVAGSAGRAGAASRTRRTCTGSAGLSELADWAKAAPTGRVNKTQRRIRRSVLIGVSHFEVRAAAAPPAYVDSARRFVGELCELTSQPAGAKISPTQVHSDSERTAPQDSWKSEDSNPARYLDGPLHPTRGAVHGSDQQGGTERVQQEDQRPDPTNPDGPRDARSAEDSHQDG